MRRRDFVALLGAAIAWPSMVAAQQVYRIGLLSTGAPIGENSPQATTLVRGLAEHGYELGRNLVIERRGAEAHPEHLPRLVEELVAQPPPMGYIDYLRLKVQSTSRGHAAVAPDQRA